MPPSNSAFDSEIERVSASIKKLSVFATDLNNASDELGKSISSIETVLQSLNIGIATWIVMYSEHDHRESSNYHQRHIGYSKVGNRWGISLRSIHGNSDQPGEESEECWLFNDAPRWLRLEGIGKIPDLLD